MRKTLAIAFSVLLFVIMISSPSTAQTADSVTPSQEQACGAQ